MALNWTPYLDLAATSVLIARLWGNGLYAVYRYFFAYLAADAIETLLGLAFQADKKLYSYIYFGGQSVKMLLAVFAVLEIYRIALAGQPALAKFGRDTVIYVLAAAAAIAALGVAVDFRIPAHRELRIQHFISFERTMDSWMLLFLVMIGVFMSWFPVRLKRNMAWYMGGFVLYFFARTVGLLLSNIAPRLIGKLDNIMIATAIFCLVLWTIALEKRGEEATTVIGHRWDPEAMKRLSGQLDAINSALTRLSRRQRV